MQWGSENGTICKGGSRKMWANWGLCKRSSTPKPSATSLKSFKASPLAPEKTGMSTKKCRWLLHCTQPLYKLLTSYTPDLCTITPCFQFILHAQLTGTCFILSFISNTHPKSLSHKQANSFSPRNPALKNVQLVKSPAEPGKTWRHLQHLRKSSVPQGLSLFLGNYCCR